MAGKINSETEYNDIREKLKIIYREILRLVIKKEEYEEQIENYLNTRKKKSNSTG